MLGNEIAASEPICRFVFGKDYYRPSDNSVRHNAFMPNKDGETSVYRTISLSYERICDLGKRFVESNKKRPMRGRANILALKIMEQQLRIEAKPIPHPRHANIINWPQDLSEIKLIAMKLARESELYLLDAT
jgi:hypothetical protein